MIYYTFTDLFKLVNVFLNLVQENLQVNKIPRAINLHLFAYQTPAV